MQPTASQSRLRRPSGLRAGIGVVFLILLRGHRWLTRLLALADAPARAIDPDGGEPVDEPSAPSPIVQPSTTLRERLAAADARHASDAAQPPERPRPGNPLV